MDGAVRKHIVISAVNIRKGGTLTVLRDCLVYLSSRKDFRVSALVHDAGLVGIPGIEYIEIPWSTRSWAQRLWCEYVSMRRLSVTLQPVDLWLSLHDTTPRVRARRQAVYCHTSFPFMKVKWQDWRFDPKIPLFSLLTRYAYAINVRRNNYLVVQQKWFREAMSALVRFPEERIIVAPPAFRQPDIPQSAGEGAVPIFLYPATADCHKNFETLCEAAALLEQLCEEPSMQAERQRRFKVVLTIDGTENRYARYLKKRYGHLKSVDFHGFMEKEELLRHYATASCLVFPSRIETWGLPISEFKHSGKPMLLADLPYAHETSAGAGQVAFFPPSDAEALSALMARVAGILKHGGLHPCEDVAKASEPFAPDWRALFNILLADS